MLKMVQYITTLWTGLQPAILQWLHGEDLLSLKLIKSDWRTKLQEHAFSDLLDIHGEGPLLSNFSADRAQSKFGGGTVVPPGESISVQRKAYCPQKKAST